MDTIAGERRLNRRFHLRLPVHYRLSLKGEPSRAGSGLTCDISTTGINFRSRRPLPVGAHIEVVVTWPAHYDDIYPIDLQITGFVVRSDNGRTAVRITSHKFRIGSAPAEEPVQATA
jgi:hypothetical protein